jgi:uroporphyrinogen decarboxylase
MSGCVVHSSTPSGRIGSDAATPQSTALLYFNHFFFKKDSMLKAMRDRAEKPLLRALRGDPAEQPPIWLMRQAGRYLPEYRALRARAGGFLDLCYRPELAAEATLQPIRRYGFDAAILFSDILVVPHALGVALEYREGEGPVLEPVRDLQAVARLRLDGLTARLAPVYEAIGRLVEALPRETALIGFAGAPWTVATYMVEGGGGSHDRVKLWAFSAPGEFDRLIGALTEATLAHLRAQLAAGAEAVQLFDTWAGVLPEPAFRRWCLAPARTIAARLKAEFPDAPVIGFPRGAGALLADYAAETGVDAVGLDSTVPLGWAREAVQRRVALQGNLDPLMLVAGGAAMEAEAERILAALGQGPFIFNLGHGVLPQTPPEHVAALVSRVRGART